MMRSTTVALLVAALSASMTPLAAQDAAPSPDRGRGASSNGSYVVGPEDVIEVFVWKEPELSTTVTIRPDGMITLPLAGELEAAGTTPAELGEQIADRLKQYMDRPLVTVVVKTINSPKISVLGEVRRPGRYLMLQSTSVLDAIAMGGGFTEFASRDFVVVLRTAPNGQQQRYRVNVKRMVNSNSKAGRSSSPRGTWSMSTDRPLPPSIRLRSSLALGALLLASSGLSAQQSAAGQAACWCSLRSSRRSRLATRTPTGDPQQPTGVDELPVVPDQGPGEPPPLIERPGASQGSTRSRKPSSAPSSSPTSPFASAYDELDGDEGAVPPSGEGGPEDTTIDGERRDRLSVPARPSSTSTARTCGPTWSLAYGPEIETLQDDDEERVSHSAGLLWERRMTRRTDLTAGASYLDSLDPTRHLGGEGFVLIPGRFEQSRAYFGASHLWPRATRLHFYSEYTNAESELDADDPALEVTDLSGTLALEQGIGRDSDFTLSYSYTETELESVDSTAPAPSRFSGPVDAVRAGFGHRTGHVLVPHLGRRDARAGRGELDAEDETTWIGGLEVARETEKLLLRLRYDHSLFSFGYGDTSIPSGVEGPLAAGAVLRDTEADTLSFFAELLPHQRVRLEQAVWLSRESLIEGDNLESFVTGTLLEVLLTGRNVHRLMLFSRFDYYDRDESDLLGGALSRTRFSLGFRVGLTGPQTKVGQRLATTELRKVLPSGGRL